MNCPVCTTALQAVDRQGVEIDFCPRCRGVWLDRGELEKLIERSAHYRHDDDDDDDRRRYAPPPPQGHGYPPPGYGHNGGYPPHGPPPQHRKKEGFWSRVFDFD